MTAPGLRQEDPAPFWYAGPAHAPQVVNSSPETAAQVLLRGSTAPMRARNGHRAAKRRPPCRPKAVGLGRKHPASAIGWPGLEARRRAATVAGSRTEAVEPKNPPYCSTCDPA